MAYKITTNNHERFFVYRCDVPEKILQEQFDYQDPEETQDGFFKFKGYWYHLDQFTRIDKPYHAQEAALHTEARELGYSKSPDFEFQNWNGYRPDSFYSGVLIKVSEDSETYKVATYIQKYGD